jgi:ABC-type glycerol-3-phosphate transport system substrate-binding protein
MVNVTYDMIDTATEVPGWTAQVDAANKLLAPKGIHIDIHKITAQGWTDYYTKIAAELAAGKGPDIGRAAESLLPQLIDKGQVVDLSETVKQLDTSQFYDKTFQNAGFRNGKYYGIPSGVYHMVMYYNKDLLDKVGIKLSTDWNNSNTFDQVSQYAKQLTTGNGGSKVYGFWAGPYMGFIGMYSVANGGQNVFNSDGSCALTSPQSLGVYKWFDQMLRTDKTMPTPADNTVQAPLDMFKAGRIAMMVDGTWDQQTLKNDVKKFKVGIAPVPSGSGKAVSAAFTDSYVLFTGAKHEREAREALLALQSAEAVTALSSTGVGGLPIRKDVLAANTDKLIGSQFGADDKAVFVGGLDHTQPVPYNQYYQQADDALNAVMDQWENGKIGVDQWATQACGIVNKYKG